METFFSLVARVQLHGVFVEQKGDDGLLGTNARPARAGHDERTDGLTGAKFPVVAGAAQFRDKGKHQSARREARTFVDAFHLIPALDELAFDGIAPFVEVPEQTDGEPGKFPAQRRGRRVVGEPAGEDSAQRGMIFRLKAKQLAFVPVKDGLGRRMVGDKVDVSRAGVVTKPKMGDAGGRDGELVVGNDSERGVERSASSRTPMRLRFSQ